jgi:predicted nuclease of restriction endonuclease-like RecB superfamily
LLPEADLPLRFIGENAYLDFLGPQDEPWLRVLLAEMGRFEGRRRRELCERLAEPLPCEAPYFKRRAATRVLLRLWKRSRERTGPPAPAEARARLFAAAAVSDDARVTTRAATAAALGLTPAALAAALFADLPGERLVHAPRPLPVPSEVALRTNLAVAQAVLMRASAVGLRVEGAVRPIVRLAKLRGLLCTVVDADYQPQIPLAFDAPGVPAGGGASPGPVVEVSGPFSLFRHTLLYGRALAELLPHLAWCARFELHAACALRGRIAHVALATGDPIFPAEPPAAFDSRLEERFARDVARLAPDWDVIHEPEPVRAGATLIFPDFLLRHRLHPERRVLVEIAGFWTPAYLTAKLTHLRQARLANAVLCIDEDRACADGPLPAGLSVVRFRRRVDAAAVMREVERLAARSPDGG